jgi:hypothetical protein
MFQRKDKLRISRGDDDVIWERELWSIQIHIHPSSSAILQSCCCCLLLGENSPQTPRKTHARTHKISSHRETQKHTRFLHTGTHTNRQDFFARNTRLTKETIRSYNFWEAKSANPSERHIKSRSKAAKLPAKSHPTFPHLTAYSWHPKWQILEPPEKATNLRYPKPGNEYAQESGEMGLGKKWVWWRKWWNGFWDEMGLRMKVGKWV